MNLIQECLLLFYGSFISMVSLILLTYNNDEYKNGYNNFYFIIYFILIFICWGVFKLIKINELYFLLVAPIVLIIIFIFKILFRVGIDNNKIQIKIEKEKKDKEYWKKITDNNLSDMEKMEEINKRILGK